MTLCTEWLPFEVITRKIFEPTSELVKKDAENDGLSFGREWQQQFIIAYNRKNKAQVEAEFTDAFCKDLSASSAAKLIIRSYGNLKNLIDEYCKGRGAFALCKFPRIFVGFRL